MRAGADIYLENEGSGRDAAGASPAPAPVARAGGRAASDAIASRSVTGARTGAGLEGLVGFYRREESDTPLHLILREGALSILTGASAGTLVPVDGDRFRVAGSSTVGTFDRSDDTVTLRLSGSIEGTFHRHPRWWPLPEALRRFEGSYVSDELGVRYSFAVENGRLVARQRKLGALPLSPTYQDGFFTSGFYLGFTEGTDGAIDGFTMSTARAWKVRFDRQ